MANETENEGLALQNFYLNELGDIRQPIAQGVFGFVHKVRRAPGFGTVAVKRFARRVNTRAEVETRELTAALKLSHHPNILAFHGFLFETPENTNLIGYVMEYMCDRSVYDVTRDPAKVYEGRHVINWAVQAARALAFCHSHNVIHRDVKPANLVLSNHCTKLKICDFGLARNQAPTMTQNIGSVLYMAPEVMGGTNYDHKCDVFSFAITIWEAYHRKYAATHTNSLLWQSNIMNNVRPEITSPLVDAPVRELIESAWIGEPGQRCTMQQMLTVLEALSIDYEPEQLYIRD